MRDRHFIATIIVLVVALVLSRPGDAAALSNARHALLIGNAFYPDSDAALSTPVGDVKNLGEVLRGKGFAVVTGENLTKQQMQTAIDTFVRKIEPGSIALVFFGGYGIQVARKNYLIPVDAQIWSETDVLRDGVSVDALLAELDLKGAGARVLVLDASRRNPFERRFRSFSNGLAEIKATPGFLGLNSAAAGSVVSEASAAYSPFVAELVRQIGTSESSAVQAFTNTRDAISRDSRGQQVPGLVALLDPSFYFDPARTTTEANRPAVTRAESKTKSQLPQSESTNVPGPKQAGEVRDKTIDEIVAAEEETARAYNRAHALGTRKAYEDFLARFPTGALANAARSDLARLGESGVKTSRTEPYSTAELQRKTSLDARIARAPRDPLAYYERGQFHAQRGDYPTALADFDQAIRLDRKNPEAWNNRCWVQAIMNDLPKALSDCNEALRLRPDFVDALDSRGFVNLKSGALEAAVVDYDAALALVPTHSSALYGRGIARSRLGQGNQATKDLTGALALNPMIDKDFAQYGIR